jgi:hypothetical protein
LHSLAVLLVDDPDAFVAGEHAANGALTVIDALAGAILADGLGGAGTDQSQAPQDSRRRYDLL